MRVLLADDKKRVRSALRLTIEIHHPGWTFLEAASLPQLYAALQQECPDLLLLDWDLQSLIQSNPLPHTSWNNILHAVRRHCPHLKILVLSSNPSIRQPALQSGADAFVCKADPIETLEDALHDLAVKS